MIFYFIMGLCLVVEREEVEAQACSAPTSSI